jgi:hypothetical protein
MCIKETIPEVSPYKLRRTTFASILHMRRFAPSVLRSLRTSDGFSSGRERHRLAEP